MDEIFTWTELGVFLTCYFFQVFFCWKFFGIFVVKNLFIRIMKLVKNTANLLFHEASNSSPSSTLLHPHQQPPFSTIGLIDMAVSMGPHGSLVFVVVDDDDADGDDDQDGGDDDDIDYDDDGHKTCTFTLFTFFTLSPYVKTSMESPEKERSDEGLALHDALDRRQIVY